VEVVVAVTRQLLVDLEPRRIGIAVFQKCFVFGQKRTQHGASDSPTDGNVPRHEYTASSDPHQTEAENA
jgi:hypothetical protein